MVALEQGGVIVTATHTGGADLLLSRMESARRSGKGWTARCPSHTDKTASLSIAETSDGTVLLHCFAGCPALSIVQAVGLTMADLFPNKLKPATPAERRENRRVMLQADWNAALGVLSHEATVVLCAAAYAQQGDVLSDDDNDRLDVSVQRIHAAREVLRGGR